MFQPGGAPVGSEPTLVCAGGCAAAAFARVDGLGAREGANPAAASNCTAALAVRKYGNGARKGVVLSLTRVKSSVILLMHITLAS